MFTVEKKKETITESAGRQQKKKIGKMSYWYIQNLNFLGKNKFLDDENTIKLLIVVTHVCIILWFTKHLCMLSYLILSTIL